MLSNINYKEVLLESFHADYILRHEKIFYEVAQINNELLLLEKFHNIEPVLKELWLTDELIVLAIVYRSMFAHLALKFVRITLDPNSETYTLLNFKDDVFRSIAHSEYKSFISQQLKGKLGNKNFTERIIKARNEFLAHKNTAFTTTTDYDSEDYISFNELKDYIFEMNDIFSALTFEISNTYDENKYAKNVRESSISTYETSINKILKKVLSSSEEIVDGEPARFSSLSPTTKELLRGLKILKPST